MVYIVAGIMTAVFVCGCIVHGKTELDRKADDEQQMKFLKQYNRDRKKEGR